MDAPPARSALPESDLADWRRRVAELYAEVRRRAADDPPAAWELWRAERERLYREHPQSPVPSEARAGFVARAFPYDPALRLSAPLVPDPATLVPDPAPLVPGPEPYVPGPAPAAPPPPSPRTGPILALPSSGPSVPPMRRLGTVELALPSGPARLAVFWLEEYAGGLFLPFRDATSGDETYGAGRYLLDTAKGADLGLTAAGELVLDLNFAFQPSCAFDPRWSCPLAPPENRVTARIEAGERLA